MTIGDDDSCTAAPQPATMTRFPSPRSSTTPSPSPSSGSRWFQRTNALLMTDGDDDSPCSETDCVPSQVTNWTKRCTFLMTLATLICCDGVFRVLLRSIMNFWISISFGFLPGTSCHCLQSDRLPVLLQNLTCSSGSCASSSFPVAPPIWSGSFITTISCWCRSSNFHHRDSNLEHREECNDF